MSPQAPKFPLIIFCLKENIIAVIKMNETEYLKSRINDLERIIQNRELPDKILQNQKSALLNYKSELENINK